MAAATYGVKEATAGGAGAHRALERRALARVGLSRRMPASVQSDHLTALGLAATIVVGAAYALSRERAALAARREPAASSSTGSATASTGRSRAYRRCERPRYGFYVDHIIDAIGARAS